MNSPWQSAGVSILPDDLNELMPIVGQGGLFKRLGQFRNEIIEPAGKYLSGFFMVIGGWGVGKSRVGHEICLEGVSEDVSWIIDSKPERLLEPNLQQGILPLFVRYIQITKGPFGGKIETDNWIPIAVLEGLSRLAGLRDTGGHRQKNQDRLMDLARKALRPKGWDSILPELQKVLQNPNPHDAVREALDILKEGIGIKHLWLVIDEIEDISDVERDGLPSNERQGIDQALLTVIPRVIKAEEARQEFPEVNFLLLCSQAVGDLMKQIRAIERRTGWHELTTNTFGDVEAFFRYLEANRPTIAKAIESYPKGLKEAAFFAANRNFGWFNVLMHSAHQNFREGKMGTPELLRKFAEDSPKGQGKSVFNLDAISEYRIPKDADNADVVRSMFALLPRQIGATDGVSEETAARFLSKIDSGGNSRHLFVKVREITPPAKHTILAHLIRCGFKNESGTELILPGEVRFDLQLVVDSLAAYSIALPEERRTNLLISEDQHEFEAQVSGLSPYAEHASDFSPFLHGLFMDPSYLAKGADGSPIIHLGPAFTFLLEFNRLNKMRKAEDGYLRDNAANSRLEEGYQSTVKDSGKRTQSILAGLVNAWEIERAPIALSVLTTLKLPAIKFVSSPPPPGQCNPLHLGRDGEAIVIYAGTASNHDLEPDLTKLAKEAARPIIVIIEEQDQRIEELSERLNRNVPRIAQFVTIHNLARQTAEHLIRLGLMGEAFMKDDLRTSHFHAAIGVAKDHLRRNLEEIWLKEQIEEQGLLLRPIFFSGKTSDDELRIFAKGYAGMLGGMSFHDVCQVSSGVLDERERDLFKNMVVRHVDPGPKYKGRKRFELFADQSGEYVVCAPRAIIALLDRCGNVAMSRSDLENHFFFEVPEDLRTKDVMRHITAFMQYLGLLEPDGEKVQRVSAHKLEQWVKRSRDWLEGPFETHSRAIKAIYQKEGEELLDVKAKDARHRLKESEKKLESLSLDFIGKPWLELNKFTSDDMPLYEQKLRASIRIIRDVRSAVEWVYDHERVHDFRYSNDVLQEFESQEKAPSYPLWKRITVLAGFYSGLDKKRKELIKQMEGLQNEVDKRVPDLSNGEKAFPIQVVTMPLRTYKQELEFSAEKPEKTIVVGATTLGITTVGYKLASSNYAEALGRLDAIESDLNQPGKLVMSFMEQLKIWEGLRAEISGLKREVDALVSFFIDAPAVVTANYKLAEMQREYNENHYNIEEGGIREGTDNRETAGTRAFDLINGLEEDVRKVKDIPSQLKQKIRDYNDLVVPTLGEDYSRKHHTRLSAIEKIRRILNKAPLTWPDQKAETYGKTAAKFDELVTQIDKEGTEFFAGSADTTFDTLVGLCQMELDKKTIDWENNEFKRHINMLMDKKLLTLRLI